MTTTEEYFIALGFYTERFSSETDMVYWVYPAKYKNESRVHPTSLPDIRDSFTQLKKWVIDPMEAEGYEPTNSGRFINWCSTRSQLKANIYQEITNGDIPLAMIKAATRYWESKK